jgi:superfamily I DNA/RNA helicase
VDEFQDTNPVQAALLTALLTPETTVTIVGDPNQSIYGFRGAASDVFDRFRRLIEQRGGQTVRLEQSYRTHVELVGMLNQLSAADWSGFVAFLRSEESSDDDL